MIETITLTITCKEKDSDKIHKTQIALPDNILKDYLKNKTAFKRADFFIDLLKPFVQPFITELIEKVLKELIEAIDLPLDTSTLTVEITK